MKKIKGFLFLFLTMFKIGLFTFGGGYAMVSVIEREIVEKKKLLNHQEYLDIIAIAESSPGPIAVNTATFIGYKSFGVLGSVFATLGVVLPSFIIILINGKTYNLKIKLTNLRFFTKIKSTNLLKMNMRVTYLLIFSGHLRKQKRCLMICRI